MMRFFLANLILLSSLCFGTSTPAGSSAATSEGWTELLKSGTWSVASDSEKEDLLQRLDEFFAKQKTADPALVQFATRAKSALRIQRHFRNCALTTDDFKARAKGLAEGVTKALDCAPGNASVSQANRLAQDLVDKVEGAQLIAVARSQALMNLKEISAKADSYNEADIASKLNSRLEPLSAKLTDLNSRINERLRNVRTRPEAEAVVKKTYEEAGVEYRSEFAAMVRQPWSASLFTETMAQKIGSERTSSDFQLTSERDGPGRLKFKSRVKAHPSHVDASLISSASQDRKKASKAAFKSLNNESLDLDSLLMKFPVSLGQALALTNASDETLASLCSKLQAAEKNEAFKKGAWEALDLGLAATSMIGGVAGIGLRVAGKAALSNLLGWGATAAVAGSTTSAAIRMTEALQKADLALQFANSNSELANDPKEMKRLNEALDQFAKARNDAIVNAGMTAASTAAYLASVKYLSSGATAADEIAVAAQNLRKSASEDRSFARSFSRIGGCR